jgi:glycine betaine/choline ABC-type transport system substrate-binding protein
MVKKVRDKLTPKFTAEQLKEINSLVGVLAGSPSEVASRIVMMWLKDNHQYISDILKNKPKGE